MSTDLCYPVLSCLGLLSNFELKWWLQNVSILLLNNNNNNKYNKVAAKGVNNNNNNNKVAAECINNSSQENMIG